MPPPADIVACDLSHSSLLYLFHHIFLPPKLPDGDDSRPAYDDCLIGVVEGCLSAFAETATGSERAKILGICNTLRSLRQLGDCHGNPREDALREALRDITSSDSESTICVQINQQNAGLIIRNSEDGAVFEMFELCPRNKSVLTTKGRLVRLFPAIAVHVPRDILREPDFQSTMANTMATMSHQRVAQVVPKARKAGQSHEEERDTASPAAVTELLASILLGFGKEVPARGIRKHTREEVLWNNSKLPWRRSPTWLLVRVTLQLSFQQLALSSKDIYKKFMVYFMAQILETAQARSMDSDILHTMSAKIIRRLSKLRNSDDGPWIGPIRRAMEETSQLLEERWLSIRQACESPIELSKLSKIDPDRDVYLRLDGLDEFLSSISLRKDVSANRRLAPESRVQVLNRFDLPRLSHFVQDFCEYMPFQLAAIESWVAANLGSWIQDNVNGLQTCGDLANLLSEYHEAAKLYYENSPEGSSRMLLTVLEIWIAIDKSAVVQIPLMRQYSTHVPIELYKGILLGHIQDMGRLNRAEEYLLEREEAAMREDRPSIISSFGTKGCFSSQYFDQSLSHQRLLQEIEETARREKQKKLADLSSLQKKYYELMNSHYQSSCEYYNSTNMYGDIVTYHCSPCVCCGYRESAKNLSISVHEWPLPTDYLEAKSTVFELDPPSSFRAWRDATIYFIDDVLGYHSPENGLGTVYSLANYEGLTHWHKAPTQRCHPLSKTKPHLNTHRRDKTVVNLGEDDVCVNNGLRLQYYDSDRETFLSSFHQSDEALEQCTVKLPPRSAALKSFILRTHDRPDGKTPNEVLAEQHQCPDHLSILEGKELMSLSYGHEIRWLALLTHLESPQIDFCKPETTTFLLQICLQAGPNTTRQACRNSHAVLTEDRFTLGLSKALDKRISRIEKNPEAYLALWGFQVLAAKALTMNENLRRDFLDLLARCRQISHKWAKLLYEKSLVSDDKKQRDQFRGMMFDIALICVDSFNVDQAHLESILDSPEAASILVEMSVRVRDNVGLRKTTHQQDYIQSILFERWQVLMYRASPVILDKTLQYDNNGLDLAITRCWPNYHRDWAWECVPSAEYWLQASSSSIQVLYNTLLGELLVGGSPLSRLPTSYGNNLCYQPLFGNSVLDVRPSDIAGMSFTSQGTFCGHEVHFGMQPFDDCGGLEELLLHTKQHSSTYDLVPSRVLAGQVPDILAQDFVHWYHHDTGEVEFRRLSTPWATNPDDWRLKKQDHGKWILYRGGYRMASPLSETARQIAAILGPIENIMHMHVLYNHQQPLIEVQLPRLKLEFYLLSGCNGWHSVQSRQFQGMQVDEKQSIDTLVGLQSKLVLRNSRDTSKRVVLIPEGRISVTKSSHGHVTVSVAHGTASRVQSYGIDTHLGRMTDNGTLQSKLLLCYLHALTSYCLPDPFTMHTGTEQALSILESAAVRSWTTLTEDNVGLLTQIARLTPSRQFYPEHLREMQSVHWHDVLSYLAQPGRFFTLTREIIQRVQRLQFLYPKSNAPKDIDHTNLHLVERDAIRSASLYVSGSASAAFTTGHDQKYVSRDHGQQSAHALRATRIAIKISNWSRSLEAPPDPRTFDKLYELLDDSPGKLSPRQDIGPREIQYDSKWLADPEGNLRALWCPLHYMFGHSTRPSRYQIATWLASLAYAESKSDMWEMAQIFYAIAAIPDVGTITLPEIDEYDLAQGYRVDQDLLTSLARKESTSLYASPEWDLPRRFNETGEEWHTRRNRAFSSQLERALRGFTEQLISQWPCLKPCPPTGSLECTYIKVQSAMAAIAKKWEVWYQNLLFRRYLQRIVSAMGGAEVCPTGIPNSQLTAYPPCQQREPAFVIPEDIFGFNSQLSATAPCPKLERTLARVALAKSAHDHDLQEILDHFGAKSCSGYQRQYLEDLKASNLSLNEQEPGYRLDKSPSDLRRLFQQHWTECRSHASNIYRSMVQDTSPRVLGSASVPGTGSVLSEMQAIAHNSRFWPRTPPSFFLGQLQKDQWTRLPSVWKQRVVEYGLAIAELQRADRLLSCHETDLVKELRNVGHESWNPSTNPEWLLMECESGLLIRQVQQDIANLMMTPPLDQNATMQLNMGEGKSSVIVPFVAASLGDGSQLVRVIVTKPQFKQMHRILVAKLAGMVGRQIYQLPISRDILPKLNPSAVHTIQQMVVECKTNGGILLIQPEQLLSFQLMGLECQINMRNEIAPKLLDVQAWLDDNSRDIIDESDEIFSVKFELVYTMGQQRPIEHSPARWELLQQVLGLIKELACEIHGESPRSVEIFNWQGEQGRFPRIRVLDTFGKDQLLERLTHRICYHGLDRFQINRQPKKRRAAIRRYISESSLSEEEINAVEQTPIWHESVTNTLLMLRSLIAQGIIAFSLGQKRWRVNYGVDKNRDPKTRLAVPFRAKDDPAPRAEFSHPDVAIFLTCLSYYYSGLDSEQLLDSFHRLKKDDQAQPQYHLWKASAPTLPPEFSELIGINLQDKVQFETEVFPHLRYSKGAIDYFLSKVVFAGEMKEFPKKLSTSGWDLAKGKMRPTTGFSGTNDSRYILPLDMTQLDQAEQRHTNALVLRYLLQPENKVFLVPKHTTPMADASDGRMFLETVSSFAEQTRAILDVGAQVIDLTNRQVAEVWLEVTQQQSEAAEAVIFFDEEDVITVLDRSGHSEPFQTSHFAQQTDKCLVFLDEAHTRGTDLKLPRDYRAAVTMGAKLTKDRLLQACMRMRRLGHGQSVIFCVPEEIEHKIMKLKEGSSHAGSRITVSDILKWAISETMDDTTRCIPLWVTQGLRFGKHSRLWQQRGDFSVNHARDWAKSFEEDEAKSLEQRYRPGSTRDNLLETRDDIPGSFKQKVSDHRLDMNEIHEADLQEEQERELSVEAEEERQVERPPAAEPVRHRIHPNVKRLVQHGIANAADDGFQPAFSTLATTSAAKFIQVDQFPQHLLLVTHDFARTVQLNIDDGDKSDFFQRAVNWILTSTKHPGKLFILSAYEAQHLLPGIKTSPYVTLHLYAPRTSMSQRPLDDLALYTVPQREVTSLPPKTCSLLNLFAGQLYMQSYEEYTATCDLLGLAWETEYDAEIEADGFIPQGLNAGTLVNTTQFTRSPTKFLEVFLTSVRRNNESIEKTHLGKLLSGDVLGQDEFEVERADQDQIGVEILRRLVSSVETLRI